MTTFITSLYAIASAYARMNKRQEAIKWLEMAPNEGFPAIQCLSAILSWTKSS